MSDVMIIGWQQLPVILTRAQAESQPGETSTEWAINALSARGNSSLLLRRSEYSSKKAFKRQINNSRFESLDCVSSQSIASATLSRKKSYCFTPQACPDYRQCQIAATYIGD